MGEEFAQTFGCEASAARIVGQLVVGHGSNGEVSGSGMRQNESASRGVWLHHAVLREVYAELFEGQVARKVEDETLVGERGIAHRGTYALESLVEEIVEMWLKIGRAGLWRRLVGGIAPQASAHLSVEHLGCSLGQSVLDGLHEEHIARAAGTLVACADAGGKESNAVADVLRIGVTLRRYEVGQTQTGLTAAGVLLAQEGKAPAIVEHNVVAVAVGCHQSESCPHLHPVETEVVHEAFGFGAYFPCLRLFSLDAPRKEEVTPIDVGHQFGYAIDLNHTMGG